MTLLRDVNLVEVISTKCCVALWTFSLSRLIASLYTLGAKHVKTFSEYSVLLTTSTNRTVEFCLK